jgi:hypothetical protein
MELCGSLDGNMISHPSFPPPFRSPLSSFAPPACSLSTSSSQSPSSPSPSPSPSRPFPSSPASALYFLLLFFAPLAFFLRLTSRFTSTRLSAPFSATSNFSASSLLAIFRFWLLLRVAWLFTTIPVGRCVSWTAEDVLLIFWPPGPVPLRKDSVISDSETVGRGGSCCPFEGAWGVWEKGRGLRLGRRFETAVRRARRQVWGGIEEGGVGHCWGMREARWARAG